jgi:REP element-mobilizing transposase RayT
VAGTFTNLLYHVVFSTKDRQPLIHASLRAELDKYIGGILRNHGGILLEVGGMPDHTHLVAKLPADRSVAEMVRLIKANSSKWVNERIAPGSSFGWQGGYGAFSVSASQLEDVCGYVRRQEEHHRVRTFQEEFVAFLARHGIAHDERYLWA